ncbi:MAG: hypothetical protein BA873_12865 [Desulfobulbaceae bacterium C00003063]|nr:MAG: hypothetical protein BA873_12865 [Desulfobulbaceae bacterium C00003063]
MYLTKLASIQLVLWNMLEKYNQDPADVFKKVQLDPGLMYQSGARYSLQKIAALWEEMERQIKDPCFGLTAATSWHPSHFGTLGYAMLLSTSLRITLERLIRFHRVISDAHFGELHEDKDKGTLVFTLMYKDEGSYSRGREDSALAWIMSVLRVNFQKDLAPVSVSLTHSRPSCGGKYYEFFQSPVTFDSPASRLALSLDVVDVVLPSGNDELAAFNDQAMTQYIATLSNESLVTRIKKIITEHLPSGDATVEAIAAELYLSTRKLQRLLQLEGTTFISLLNETRMEIAKQYVRDGKNDLTEVAFLLGFAELSTFSRSFKRWTGQSPIQYRKAA